MSSNLAVLIEAKRLIRTLGERISLPLKAKILSQTSVYSLGSFYVFHFDKINFRNTAQSVESNQRQSTSSF